MPTPPHDPSDMASVDGRTDLEGHLNAVHLHRLNDLVALSTAEQQQMHEADHAVL